MNMQQIQAPSQAVITVTQLREKANTRSYKVRPQEQLGKKRSVYFHSGETVREAPLGRSSKTGKHHSHCLLENMRRKEKMRGR